MESYLDKMEATASFYTQLESRMSVQIECNRQHFERLCEEIKEEYDLTVVEDVKITQEKIPNQLSNIYGVLLHGVRFMFHIKD